MCSQQHASLFLTPYLTPGPSHPRAHDIHKTSMRWDVTLSAPFRDSWFTEHTMLAPSSSRVTWNDTELLTVKVFPLTSSWTRVCSPRMQKKTDRQKHTHTEEIHCQYVQIDCFLTNRYCLGPIDSEYILERLRKFLKWIWMCTENVDPDTHISTMSLPFTFFISIISYVPYKHTLHHPFSCTTSFL